MRPDVERHRSARAAIVLVALVVLPLFASACSGSSTTATTGVITPGSTGFTPKDAGGSAVTTAVPSSTTTTTAAGGTTTSLGTPTLKDTSTISTVGLDKVQFGMTLAEAEKAAGSKLTSEAPKSNCYAVKPEQGAAGISFLVSDGRVESVTIDAPPIATKSGAKVGSTEAQIKDLYPGQIELQPRLDGQPGNQLVFTPKDAADAKFRLVFFTDGTTVKSYRAGRVPQVLAATGCK
jgi:hypothetical protein